MKLWRLIAVFLALAAPTACGIKGDPDAPAPDGGRQSHEGVVAG